MKHILFLLAAIPGLAGLGLAQTDYTGTNNPYVSPVPPGTPNNPLELPGTTAAPGTEPGFPNAQPGSLGNPMVSQQTIAPELSGMIPIARNPGGVSVVPAGSGGNGSAGNGSASSGYASATYYPNEF